MQVRNTSFRRARSHASLEVGTVVGALSFSGPAVAQNFSTHAPVARYQSGEDEDCARDVHARRSRETYRKDLALTEKLGLLVKQEVSCLLGF